MSTANPVAIVTGAASGIGRATAERLLDTGHAVVIVDRNESDLSWTSNAPSDRLELISGDLTKPEVNELAVKTALAKFGRLDASVLNAGISVSGDLLTLPIEQFDRAMEVNVRAVLLGIRAAIPAMRPNRHGAIVVTASTSGLGGDPGMWAYNSSKAAVINLVRGASLDLGVDNIRINAVCPGPTETGMTARIKEAPAVYESLQDRIALKRWAQPDEIAAAICFLVSDDASFITGVALPVDGGITASTGQFSPRPAH